MTPGVSEVQAVKAGQTAEFTIRFEVGCEVRRIVCEDMAGRGTSKLGATVVTNLAVDGRCGWIVGHAPITLFSARNAAYLRLRFPVNDTEPLTVHVKAGTKDIRVRFIASGRPMWEAES